MLEAAIRADRLHHAYLFSGPAHVGKMTLALQLAQAMNCLQPDQAPCGECQACTRIAAGTHADVQVLAVDPEATEGPKTLIGIETVRDVIASAHLRPYEGKTRVFIFEDTDRLSHDAGNALLKVLEEPPPDVLLVLLSEDVSQEQAEVIARLSRGCLGWAIEASTDPALLAGVHQRVERIADVAEGGLEERFGYADDLARRFQRDRAVGREELRLWLRWLRDILLIQQGQHDGIVNTTWRETLERQAAALTPADTVRWLHLLTDSIVALERNANPRLALEVLMLDAPRLKVS